MTIDEAIEMLLDYAMQSAFEATPDFKDALQLGIEALKRQKLMRENSGMSWDFYLPGETKD